MYRRPKFLEIIDEVRQEMSREADYDVDLFAEFIRNGLGKKEFITEIDETAENISVKEDLAPESKR